MLALRHAAFGLDPRCAGSATPLDDDPLLEEIAAKLQQQLGAVRAASPRRARDQLSLSPSRDM